MFINYLKIALRNLLRHKIFSFINISGLALGMTCSILIMLWVQDERSFDQFHENKAQLYQIKENQHYPGGEDLTVSATPGLLADALKKSFPEIVQAAKVTWQEQVLFTYRDKVFKENGHYASPDFFTMFSFPFVKGNPKTAINQPNSVVITESLANKYFGTTEALGKLFKINNTDTYKVTGVIRDVPKNSSLQFNFVMPTADFENRPGNQWLKTWGSNGILTFIKLHPNANGQVVTSKIKDFIRKNNKDSNVDLFTQPITDVYLYGKFTKGQQDGGRIEYVRLFSVVAVFILIIACINFMNLATARSVKRAKEVGVRKVIGAIRAVLVGQFIGESILLSLLAIVVSIALTQLLLPSFNQLTGKFITLHYTDPEFIFSLLSIALVTGVIAGSYPALFLSSFKPVAVLKGTLKFSRGAVMFRKGLVVFQFILSAVLIISTLVVYRQVDYIRTKNLGLDRENVAYVPLEGKLKEHYPAFKNELLQTPGIKAITASNQNPLMVGTNGGGVEWRGKNPNADILFTFLQTDYDFIKTMGIELKEGRVFSKEFGADTANFLVNEEAVRLMQLKQPIGETLKNVYGIEGHIVGVIKDFHVTSLHSNMQPVIMMLAPENSNYVFVRTEAGRTQEAIANLGKVVKRYNPDYPYEYHFLDEDFEQMYRSEAVIGQLANYFAFLGIFISCLGLFGLALFTAEQRTKEIGIRKVLGASVFNITRMLSLDFLKLVFLANIIAWPLAAYVMNNWLQNFQYRTDLAWWIFALAGGATLLIALLTVSYHAIRTAVTNPVTSLRSE